LGIRTPDFKFQYGEPDQLTRYGAIVIVWDRKKMSTVRLAQGIISLSALLKGSMLNFPAIVPPGQTSNRESFSSSVFLNFRRRTRKTHVIKINTSYEIYGKMV